MSATNVRPDPTSATDVASKNRGAFAGNPLVPEGSGSGYNGLFRTEDAVTPVPTGQPVSGALVTFGGNASISNSSQFGLNLGSQFTIEGWISGILPSVNNTRKCILSKLDSTGGYEINWWRDNGGAVNFECLVRQDASTIGTIAPSFTTAHFENTLPHHFAFVFQSGTAGLYVDGVGPFGTAAITPTTSGSSSAGLFVASNPTPTNNWSGTPSNFRFWNTAKTQSEVIADMRSDTPKNPGYLRAYYKFISDSLDYSGNGNHLTQSGSLSFGTISPFAVYGSTTRYYGGSADGFVQTQGSTTFAAARNATTGNLAASGGTGGTVSDERIFGSLFYVSRVGLSFNTTNPTAGIVVVGAHLYAQPASGTSTANAPFLDVDKFSPGAGTGIQLTDFRSVSGTAGARTQHVFVGGAYGYLELGTPALSWINTGGVTSLALRTGNDMNNTQPGGITLSQYIINMNEQTGTITDPFLDVVTVPR